jgi:hypothetical protein
MSNIEDYSDLGDVITLSVTNARPAEASLPKVREPRIGRDDVPVVHDLISEDAEGDERNPQSIEVRRTMEKADLLLLFGVDVRPTGVGRLPWRVIPRSRNSSKNRGDVENRRARMLEERVFCGWPLS